MFDFEGGGARLATASAPSTTPTGPSSSSAADNGALDPPSVSKQRTHIAVLADNGTIRYLSIDGASPDFDTQAALGRPLEEFIAPEHRTLAAQCIADALHGRHRECEVSNTSGRVYLTRYAPLPSPEGTLVLAVATDITENRKMKSVVLDSEKKYRELVENINDILFSVNERGYLTYISPAVTALAGYSPEELIGRPFQEFIHPEDLPAVVASYEETLSGVDEPSEYRVRTRWGHYRWVRSHSRRATTDGEVTGIRGVMCDVTERRRAENALREAEQRYRSMFDNAFFGISISTPDGRFLDVNRSLVAMLGYESAEELKAVDIADALYVDPEERQRVLEWVRSGDSFKPMEVHWRRKDGDIVLVRLSGRAIRGETGDFVGFECTAENVTERYALEEQYRQGQKMEAIGRLAGGVAHDFNNLLTVINGHADLLLAGVEPSEGGFKDLSEIRRAGERAASLTSQLLAFSRRQILQPVVLDLNEIIEGGSEMLRRIIGEDIELSVHLTDAVVNFVGDRNQIEQVLVNLVVNARDAMPGGGRLTIATERRVLSTEVASEHATIPAGTYVVLSCVDTGCGIDSDIRRHIFEPFFTTKEVARGTGLGLATVYGILEQSGGFIEVETKASKGTRFTVYLPTVDRPAERADHEPVSERPVRGEGTILVVEDDDAVRVTAVDMLEMCGYTVSSARDGNEALALGAERRGELDLLITDVVMPGMSGRELATTMLRENPTLSVIFMTGYADEDVLGDTETLHAASLIKKPFSITMLSGRVRQALNRSSTSPTKLP